MRARAVAASLGAILTIASAAFLVPAVLAAFLEPRDAAIAGVEFPRNAAVFLACAAAFAALGQLVRLVAGRPPDLRDIEGYGVVALSWLLVPAMFATPFLAGRALDSPVDAFFESMSGVTTTGFSVIPDLDAVAPSIVFWRSWIQWVGGGGIAVLSVAVLSRLTESGARLMRAELPGGSVTRLKPKITQTAKSLWGVYVAVSVVAFGLLFAAFLLVERAPWDVATWESVNLAMTGISTGGFAPHAAGFGAYSSPWVRHALVVAMVLGGTSMTLLWFAAHGEPRRLLRDLEWRTFLVVLLGSSVLVTLIVAGTPASAWPRHDEAWAALGVAEPGWSLASVLAAFGAAIFNVTSIVTTAGFGYPDYDAWPEAARILLLLLLFPGACAGSTAGALKLARVILLTKVARREMAKLVHPNAYVPVRIGGAVVSEDTIRGVIAFFFAYVSLAIASTIFLALFGLDFFTAASASAGSLGNVGIGMGAAGPCCTLAEFHPVAKAWLAIVMWLGRLEIFAALLLLLPSTYRR